MKILSLLVGSLALTGADPSPPVQRSYSPPPRLIEAVAREPVAEAADARELSILTYNVRGLPWPVASGRTAALRSIGEELGRLRREGRQPDVVLVQEGFEDIGELVRLSGYRHWAKGPQRRDRRAASRPPGARWPLSGEGWGRFTGAGLHVLTDLPIAEVETKPFGACAGFDCLANKGAMLVRLTIPGLPAPLEIVNTHMNSKAAAKVPLGRSLRVHKLQSDALFGFIATARTPGSALLVGGDFNVKRSPDRYYYRAAERPFLVVSEFCRARPEGCRLEAKAEGDEPWLEAQDLQAFGDGAVTVRPVAVARLFAGGETGPRLSDHDGLLVRYRLSWRREAEPERMVADLR
jgi:endonuclease/exonuclease/phosphatase family metal-dependent hydrolase